MLCAKIVVANGYPHSIQVVGHNLVDVDSDGIINESDWTTTIHKTAVELRRKDCSAMYAFGGRKTGREKILDVMTLFGAMNRKDLIERCKEGYNLKNAYQYIGDLEKSDAIRTLSDGRLDLHSQSFRTSVLMVLLPGLDPHSQLGKLWGGYVAKLIEDAHVATDSPRADDSGTHTDLPARD